MIKNIVFDLGNVLLKSKPEIVLDNIELKEEEKQEIREKFFGHFRGLNMGDETLEEHFNNCRFSFTISKDVKEKLVHYYKYRTFNDEVVKLMNKFKTNNYNIFILSNNNKETYEYLKTLPEFKCVDGWIVSCDYKIAKPDRKIYIKLFEEFNLKPEECYFIDDKKQNIEVGKEFGMQGFVIDVENEGIDKLLILEK